MDIYDFDPNFARKSQSAFPECFRAIGSVAFHGTSCAYCDKIESEGFEHRFRPFPSEEFARVADHFDPYSDLAQSLRLCHERPVRLSLTKDSLAALEYSLKGQGGQSLGFLREALKRGVALSLEVNDLLSKIDSADACVYAVSLDLIPQSQREQSGNVILLSGGIPKEAILAKVIVPRSTDYNSIKVKKGMEAIMASYGY